MGKIRRFRLSDMMPNAWFYKLRDFNAAAHKKPPNKPKLSHLPTSTTPHPSKPDHQTQQQHYSYSRKSYHFTRDLNLRHDRKSSAGQRSNRRTSTTTARLSPKFVSSSSSVPNRPKPEPPLPDYSASLSDSDSFSPEFRSDCSLTTESFDKKVSWSSNSCGCPLELVDSSSASSDIIIDVDKHSLSTKKHAPQVFDHLPDLHLSPILTKKETKDQSTTKQSTGRKHYYGGGNNSSPGIKLRANSPRIGCQYRRKNQMQGGRKSLSSERSSPSSSSRRRMSKTVSSGCLAVVKSSYDPQRDFRESMVEMIVEKNISASKDLEDLLACYLSLNSDEYHDVIIKVFKQIWFDYLITTSK